jgi:hypothetical protein
VKDSSVAREGEQTRAANARVEILRVLHERRNLNAILKKKEH